MRLNKIGLTEPCDFGILKTSKVTWGRSAPRQSGEKGDCSLWCDSAPEMCLPARAAAVHVTVDSLRRFFASEIENHMRCKMEQNRWYHPQDGRDALDAIESVKSIVRFLNDTITQEAFKPGSDLRYSEDGINGLFHIYCLIEDVLDDSLSLLNREVKL